MLYYVHRPDSTFMTLLIAWGASMGENPKCKSLRSALSEDIPQRPKTAFISVPSPDNVPIHHQHSISANMMETLIAAHRPANLQGHHLDELRVSKIREIFLSELLQKLFFTDSSVFQRENCKEETEVKSFIAASIFLFDDSELPQWCYAPHAAFVVLAPMLNDADESTGSNVIVTVTPSPLKQELLSCAQGKCISSATLQNKEARKFRLQPGQFLVTKQAMFTATMSVFTRAIPILVLFIFDSDCTDTDLDKVAKLEEIFVALHLLRNHRAMDNLIVKVNDTNMETRLTDEDIRILDALEAPGKTFIHNDLREASPVTGIHNFPLSDASGLRMKRQILSSRNARVTEH